MGRAIGVGDEVVAKHPWVADDLAQVYGEPARRPFIVERVVRQPRYAVVGGGHHGVA